MNVCLNDRQQEVLPMSKIVSIRSIIITWLDFLLETLKCAEDASLVPL